MNNTMKLKKFDEDFTTTSAAQSFAAAIEARVMGAQEAGLSVSSTFTAQAPQRHGRAA